MLIRIVLTAAALTACTAPQPASAPAPTTVTSTAKARVKPVTCASAPEGVVGPLLGMTLGRPAETGSDIVTICQYEGGGVNTMVRFQAGTDAVAFARGKEGFGQHGQTAVDLPRFHDEAYTSTLKAGGLTQNTVVARKGNMEILVTSSAGIDAEKKLITELFSRLPVASTNS